MTHHFDFKKYLSSLVRTKYFLFFIGLFIFINIGCATGHCRGRATVVASKIFIFKPDGSKQCSPNSEISLDEMAKELQDIKIYSRKNVSDGKIHMTLCGSPTGRLNVYEIDSKDFARAQPLGFEEYKGDH